MQIFANSLMEIVRKGIDGILTQHNVLTIFTHLSPLSFHENCQTASPLLTKVLWCYSLVILSVPLPLPCRLHLPLLLLPALSPTESCALLLFNSVALLALLVFISTTQFWATRNKRSFLKGVGKAGGRKIEYLNIQYFCPYQTFFHSTFIDLLSCQAQAMALWPLP